MEKPACVIPRPEISANFTWEEEGVRKPQGNGKKNDLKISDINSNMGRV
jgi:hypothetical protein